MGNVTKLSTRVEAPETKRPPHAVPADDLAAAGKRLRDTVPRASQGVWKRQKDRTDPLASFHTSDSGRMAELIPIRYGRMLQSPFTYYRRAASVMAADLAVMPTTGVRVQACGDCHLLNFGGFATPERNITFDINDFDETPPAPWEWTSSGWLHRSCSPPDPTECRTRPAVTRPWAAPAVTANGCTRSRR